MAKNNQNTTNIIMVCVGALLVYIGGHLQYNSGSYMRMTDFMVGLAFVIFGSMLVGVSINKISVNNSKVKPSNAKKSKK